MARPAGVALLAATLLAGGRELPKRPRRYLVLWGGARGRVYIYIGGRAHRLPLVYYLAEIGGVKLEVRKYTTTVRGRRYDRYKIIVRDYAATRKLAELARDEARLRRWLVRYRTLVMRMLACMARVPNIMNVLRFYDLRWVRRWMGIRPFDYTKYHIWRTKKVARELSPSWGRMKVARWAARMREESYW